MTDRAPEGAATTPEYRVVQALGNNAVVARTDNGLAVLVGKGIGFGRRADDLIGPAAIQQHYLALDPEKLQYFSMLSSIRPETLQAITAALDLAVDRLGDLHPSVYLLLTDHLAFAIQRYTEGQVVANNLLAEIRTRFPEEFEAAEGVLALVNERLDIALPIDEAAFITLHLNAARSGASVKQPLGRVNALAAHVDYLLADLDASGVGHSAREELTSRLAALTRRLVEGRAREFASHRSIERDLDRDWERAARVVGRIVEDEDVRGVRTTGEIAFLAVFLNGWFQDHATP